MSALVVRGDARRLPLPDASVDLICTSPPFLNLRSYQDGGRHYDGQIGTGTRDQFLNDLWEVTAECARVLKPTGSMFVELGDSYTEKSLNLSPHRYVIGCIDRLGLLLRAEMVWSHPNGLPESVTDRVRRSHSIWFHFVKQPRYYSAVDEIRERHVSAPGREGARCLGGQKTLRPVGPNSGQYNPLGKLPGSVWEVASEPLTVPDHLPQHFAAFPTEWPRRIITGWSPQGICTACGEGRRPIAVTAYEPTQRTNGVGRLERNRDNNFSQSDRPYGRARGIARIIGYTCACPDPSAPIRPAVVLDPFGGTGTTALVASALGRVGITVDRSADYCRLASWRTTDPGQRARALGVPKPPVQSVGQMALFEGGPDVA